LDIQYGKSPSAIRNDDGEYFIWGTGGIVGRTNDVLCEDSAILIGRKGTISRPYLIRNPFWAIDTTFFCTPRRKDDIRWIYHYLESIDLTDYNEASGVPSLSRNTLNSIKIPMPTVEEQSRIAEVLEISDNEMDILGKLKVEYQQQKQALMQQLLTGQVRVNVAEDSVGKAVIS
jgi:type I restriction enzyme S subunit